MKKYGLALAALGMLGAAQAGPFNEGIGGAMYYGPYTGGHGYSYNTAYGYGFAFSSADTWRRDPFAYPAGIYPYRPYEKPITWQVFPKPAAPYVSVPGPDGLPILVPTVPPPAFASGAPVVAAPSTTPALKPVPASLAAERPARIKVHVPEGALLWIDSEKTAQAGTDRVFETPPLPEGKTHVISVRAKWNAGDREVEQFRVVGVRAGETAKVAFPSTRP
jgi:uncharacterized protein (TIGR03000 family)